MSKEKNLKQILSRLKRLEIAVFGTAGGGLIKKTPKTIKKNSLPKLIIQLRGQGFFKQPKTPLEVQKKLQPIYPCDPNRVEVALLRLHKKKQLRKTSRIVGGKKVLTYVW